MNVKQHRAKAGVQCIKKGAIVTLVSWVAGISVISAGIECGDLPICPNRSDTSPENKTTELMN